VYDRRLHDPVPDALAVKPQHSFVLVEGMLLLHDDERFKCIKEHLDECLFLEVDEESCHKRVVARKVLGGRDRDDAERHYERVDLPNVMRINQTKERASLILHLGPDGEILGVRTPFTNCTHAETRGQRFTVAAVGLFVAPEGVGGPPGRELFRGYCRPATFAPSRDLRTWR